MDDQVCPRCKTTKYRNPSLKLMVNICGHGLCESCVDLLFLKGSGSCPECNVPLRRSNFRVQLFEDATVEKEVEIRKRVLRDYNKREEDFPSLREYNDYLEEIEHIIHNLTNNIDVFETNRKIEQYKKENKEVILKNRIKPSQEELELDAVIEDEKQTTEKHIKQLIKEEQEWKKNKINEKEALIDELMLSNADAKNIVSVFAQNAIAAKKESQKQVSAVPTPKVTQFSTGIKFSRGQQSMYHPVVKADSGPLFEYKKFKMVLDGPEPPVSSSIESDGYIVHMRPETVEEKAGGYTADIACTRALQEAFIGLYHVKQRHETSA